MSYNYSISITALLQLIFLTVIITTTNLVRTLSFAAFWVASLAMLMIILNKKRWTHSVWLAFGAFATTTVTGVLLSTNRIADEITLGIVVVGLLIVTSTVNALGEPKRGTRRQKSALSESVPVYTTMTGSKYHRKDCRLIKNRKTHIYPSAAHAQGQGKSACHLCN